ncbi:MAG: hypothetical protein ABL890_01500 [Candidatus Peribacteraceae bacterium]
MHQALDHRYEDVSSETMPSAAGRVSVFRSYVRIFSRACLALAVLVPTTATVCISSIKHRLEEQRLKCEQLFLASDPLSVSEIGEDGIPRDLQALCDTLTKHARYAPAWDLEYLIGDLDLRTEQRPEGEVWVGRCGGFADYFLSEAAQLGYRPSMLFAALPRDDLLPIGMHFYGSVEKDGKHYLLESSHSSTDSKLTFRILPCDSVGALHTACTDGFRVSAVCHSVDAFDFSDAAGIDRLASSER